MKEEENFEEKEEFEEFEEFDEIEENEEFEKKEKKEESKLSSLIKSRKKTNVHTTKREYWPGMQEALRLQREYESGQMDRGTVSSLQLDNLIKLYEQQISELSMKISAKRRRMRSSL